MSNAAAFGTATAAIASHLATAAGSANLPLVEEGWVSTVQNDMATWWYDGDADSDLFPDTLTTAGVGEQITVAAFMPLRDQSGTTRKGINGRLHTFKAVLLDALEGDRSLNDACDLTIGDAVAEPFVTPSGPVAVLSIPLVLHFRDAHDIAR